MKHSQPTLFILNALAALMLTACGGGKSDDLYSQNDVGILQGVQTSSVYTGPISGFGSVIVNGLRFSTIGAGILDDDERTLSHTDLHIGTTVEVTGTGNDATGLGNATSIRVLRGTQGSISAIAANQFTLLGQRVVVNAKTAYQNTSGLAALQLGDTVEAYGITQADGSLIASLIEKKALTANVLTHHISNLDTVAKTFLINGMTVNYSAAAVNGALSNGAKVRVNAASGAAANTLTATSITRIDDTARYAATGAIIKLKGIAAAAPVAGVVMVSGTSVNLANAVYQGGTAIVAGSPVEVRGTWSGNTLLANLVEFEGYREASLGGSNELYGTISAYTSPSQFVLNGVTVDASSVSGIGAALQVGTYLEAKGNMLGNVFKATRIEFKNASAPSGGYYETYGVVSNFVSLANFTVNGMQINASAAYLEHPERGGLANGRYIELKGAQTASGVFNATKVEVKY